jgi:hypothetical protein
MDKAGGDILSLNVSVELARKAIYAQENGYQNRSQHHQTNALPLFAIAGPFVCAAQCGI